MSGERASRRYMLVPDHFCLVFDNRCIQWEIIKVITVLYIPERAKPIILWFNFKFLPCRAACSTFPLQHDDSYYLYLYAKFVINEHCLKLCYRWRECWACSYVEFGHEFQGMYETAGEEENFVSVDMDALEISWMSKNTQMKKAFNRSKAVRERQCRVQGLDRSRKRRFRQQQKQVQWG